MIVDNGSTAEPFNINDQSPGTQKKMVKHYRLTSWAVVIKDGLSSGVHPLGTQKKMV